MAVAPKLERTSAGHYKCRLVFGKKCSGTGEENEKPYWLQVDTFEELAEQCSTYLAGDMVVALSRVNANRWYAPDTHILKVSQNYIGFRIGSQLTIGANILWLPGRPRKTKEPVPAALPHVVGDEVPSLDGHVNTFLHGANKPSDGEANGFMDELPGEDDVPF